MAFRRIFDASALSSTLVVAAMLSMLSNAAPAWANDASIPGTQPVSEITQAAEDYLRERVRGTNRQVTPRAGNLDPRLRLPLCDAPLEGFLRAGSKVDRRTVVGVRCSGSRPWKVYVPVDVVEFATVLVARRSLPRDHLLGADDLVSEERDVSGILSGYISDVKRVIGQRLKRRVVSGSVISPSMLEEQILVRRGQSVTLVVRDASLGISMAGTALMDGALNQRIRVENTASERIVEGLVRSAQHVEVLVR